MRVAATAGQKPETKGILTMKLKIYTLNAYWHNVGQEVEVYATKEELHQRLVTVMDIGAAEDWGDKYRAQTIQLIKDTIAKAQIEDAFDLWQSEDIKHPDDCFDIQEHEFEVPVVNELVESLGNAIAYMKYHFNDDPRTMIFVAILQVTADKAKAV
jgi:hypothetical protein